MRIIYDRSCAMIYFVVLHSSFEPTLILRNYEIQIYTKIPIAPMRVLAPPVYHYYGRLPLEVT